MKGSVLPMRMPVYPCSPKQPAQKLYHQQIPWRPQSILEQQIIHQKILKENTDEKHKLFVNNINPFNVCPTSFTVFFPVFKDHTTIGVSLLSLRKLSIVIRQAIEPHDCVFSMIRIIELRTPFPLVLLAMFSAVGLFISGSVGKIIEDFKEISQTLVEENHKATLKAINPFNVCPTAITVFFPIYKNHTTIGVSFLDLENMSIVIRQALEPHDCLFSMIRIIELRVPYPLNLLALFLSIGIFFSGGVEKVAQETRGNI